MKFNKQDTSILLKIMQSRRDVRGNNFIQKEIEKDKLDLILDAAILAPSVGYSQPWKFILINDKNIKKEIFKNFENENNEAKKVFKDKNLYKNLKLEGIIEAPLNIAVIFETPSEEILGTTSMDNMGEYSVVCAIQNMWLMARSLNIGLGWVSILDASTVLKTLQITGKNKLIAYLCLGYVKDFANEPELKTIKWEQEKERNSLINTSFYSNLA